MIPSYRPRPTARRPAIGRFKRLLPIGLIPNDPIRSMAA